MLLKAIRSLPEREQDAVLVYLLDRSFAPAPPTTSHDYTRTLSFRPSLTAAFPGAQMHVGLSEGSGRRDAALILHRLAAGASVEELARLLGLDSDLLAAVLEHLAKCHHGSGRLAEIFRCLADGKLAAEVAADLGMTEDEVADELEPSEQLISIVCAALMARSALPNPPPGAVGASGPLRTMPVRFSEQQYERLKAWCEENKFPMAVVVRGVVERFLDEQQATP